MASVREVRVTTTDGKQATVKVEFLGDRISLLDMATARSALKRQPTRITDDNAMACRCPDREG